MLRIKHLQIKFFSLAILAMLVSYSGDHNAALPQQFSTELVISKVDVSGVASFAYSYPVVESVQQIGSEHDFNHMLRCQDNQISYSLKIARIKNNKLKGFPKHTSYLIKSPSNDDEGPFTLI